MVVTAASLLAVAATMTAAPAPALADQLDQPTDVEAVAGRRAITASWTAPPGEVHHYIATATPVTSGTTQTCVTADATDSCLIQGTSGLTANAWYRVAVVACPTASNFDDCSEPSDSSDPVLTGPPAVPTSPSAAYTGTAGQVRISWTQPGVTDGIETFRVTPTPAVSSPTGTCTADLAATATDCTLGGLTAGTSYTFKVAAVGANGTGTSAASTATAPIVAGPPNRPTGVTVAHLSDTSVTLTWQAPTTGQTPASYTVTSSPSAAAGACADINALTCNFTGLTASTEYTFTVHANGPGANGGSGPSAESVASAAITPGKPGPMLKPTVTVTGSGVVSVAWDAPLGGSTPTDYTVTSDPVATPDDSCLGAVAASPCTFDNLDPATPYTFTVTANGAGDTTTSPDSDPVVAGPPIVTVKPTAAVTGVGDVTVSWPLPGGGVPDEYDVADQDGPISECQDLTVRECVLTGLDDEVTYTFTVTATNTFGSDFLAGDPVIPGAPSAIDPPDVEATDEGELTLSWDVPTGGAVTDYTVAAATGSAPIPAECVGAVVRTCVIADLDPATAYSFTVSARGSVGSPAVSSASALVTPGPPLAPDAPVATSTVAEQIVLDWDEPAGGPVESYTVAAEQGGVSIPGGCVGTANTDCTITGLDDATSYTFTVTANAVVGDDATSEPSNAVVPGPPGVVSKPTVEVTGSGQLTVRWTEPAGGAVESYTVAEVGGTPTGCTTITARECVIPNLPTGDDYSFTVIATNVIDSSTVSQASDPVIPDAPGTPAAPTVEVTGEGTVDVDWVAPAGGAVTAYTLVSDPPWALPDACVETTNLTCTITDLDPATPYAFQIIAGNAVDDSVESVFSAPVIAGPPDAPAAPTATVTGPSTVQVDWTLPAGGEATDYEVVSQPLVTPPAGCELTSDFTCSYTGLDPAETYTFTVTAIGPGGDSDASATSNAVIPGPPERPAPPSIEVTASGSVELNWTEPGGGPIDDWTVLTAGNSTVMGCADQVETTCTVTALDPTLPVSYKVRANAPGGDMTSLVSETVIPGPPVGTGTPTVELTEPNQATVSWTPPTGGGSVTGYTVTSSPGEQAPLDCVNTTATECVFTGLDSETEYSFTVTARGPGGDETSGASAGAIPSAPGAPGTPEATLDTRGEAIIEWTEPTTGGEVVGYRVSSNPAVQAPDECLDITDLTCVFTGLDEETEYTFTVRAVNTIDGTDSAPSNAVVPGPPTAPGRPTVTSTTAGEVTVSWEPSEGGELTGYTVSSYPSEAAPAECTDITATSCVFTGLDSGTRYTFTVTADGPLGSNPSQPSEGVVPGVPDYPHTPEVVSIARDTVRVTWEAGEEGAPETGFRVVSDPVVTIPAGCRNALVFTCDVTGLAPATSYRFRVFAINNAGETPSEYSEAIVPGRPFAPTQVEVAAADRQLAVSWTAPDQAAERVAYYRVATTPASSECRTADVTETECVLIGLENLRWYTVQVVAVGIGGTGDSPAGESRLVRPTAGAPGAPTAVQATGRNASALVSWTAPAAVGNGVIRYTATATSASGDSHTCVTATITAVSCVITGLTNLREYRVTVVSIGKAASGNSVASTPVSVTPSVVPGAPTNVQVTPGVKNLAVSFTPGDPGNGVSGYTVTATGGATPLTCPVAATATSCVITGLTPGTNYTVTVVANGSLAGAVSEASAPAGPIKALYAAPPAPPTSTPTSGGALTSSAGTALRIGGTTTISGTGYAPHTGITVALYSGAVRLATTTTDATGAFTVPVTISGVTLTGTTPVSRTIVAGGQSSSTSTSLKWKTLTVQVGPAQ
ncbi:hypothetical protein ACTI_26310 [Actinoplanes sp. OR16]|uniref:fibronectin type III domain-containing protein n=1 Tax=Actinoplanes sp. OR16 TaxID=946334 RepID=UPI000F6D0DCD|nr:fibronectin type III domain-containing protein [Actinoplanes sp. OR16]BBH65946.1 hypothetical protein ACTI_26310 [Actinoplanes sp. OR16]